MSEIRKAAEKHFKKVNPHLSSSEDQLKYWIQPGHSLTIEAFIAGADYTSSKLTQERDSLLEKLKMAEEKFSVLETEEWYWEYHPYIKDGKEQPGLIKNISKIREFARECLQKLRGESK